MRFVAVKLDANAEAVIRSFFFLDELLIGSVNSPGFNH